MHSPPYLATRLPSQGVKDIFITNLVLGAGPKIKRSKFLDLILMKSFYLIYLIWQKKSSLNRTRNKLERPQLFWLESACRITRDRKAHKELNIVWFNNKNSVDICRHCGQVSTEVKISVNKLYETTHHHWVEKSNCRRKKKKIHILKLVSKSGFPCPFNVNVHLAFFSMSSIGISTSWHQTAWEALAWTVEPLPLSTCSCISTS